MNYLRPDRLDALARAHALGTLSPGAARRFSRVLAGSTRAAQAVAEWQELLQTLEAGAPRSPAPRALVWEGLEARLFERDEPARSPALLRGSAGRRGGGRLVGGWLGWPVGLAAGALMLWSLLVLRPQLFNVEAVSGAAPASYVGVLQDPQGHALLATTARRQGRVLTVRMLRHIDLPPGQALTVWAWNDTDPTPRRIGAWAPAAQTTALTLAAPAEQLLGTMTHLGISSEPATLAAPAPTHPLIAQGPCAKVW
jgi:anti-sigma-K factor RskA